MKAKKRKPSMTRVVGYRFGGDIDLDHVTALLNEAQRHGVVTQFDFAKSMTPGQDDIWFNGPPGRAMRALRAQIKRCVL